ncbi:hypothetical protein PAHAL_6G086600 [Panicum hallii]|nr:uncharacterized protein LOC112897381 isoform X2 [Panicum hallii]PAN34344.1 hypothetical protein PAHAL_6G086600 [Panicum hallii]
MKMQGSNTQSGGVSLPDDESENPSSDPFSISSSGADSLSGSDAKLPQGMETSKWGGVDHETAERCRHGKRPRRLLCWDGNNTGRRYLACPLRGKFNMCDFISWVDDQWPPMFQRVVASIGEVVGKFKKKLDDLQVDLLEAIQLRNDAVEENEAILSEKQEQLLENQRLEREFTMRTRLAQTTCSTLQNRISNDLYDKNMLYGFILCMFRVIVAILFGIALKK